MYSGDHSPGKLFFYHKRQRFDRFTTVGTDFDVINLLLDKMLEGHNSVCMRWEEWCCSNVVYWFLTMLFFFIISLHLAQHTIRESEKASDPRLYLVTDAIEHALFAWYPRARYPVGVLVWTIARLVSISPASVADFLTRMIMPLPKPQGCKWSPIRRNNLTPPSCGVRL